MYKSSIIASLALTLSGTAYAQNAGIVGDGLGCNYATLAIAVNAASDGDVIVVPKNTTTTAWLSIVTKDVTIANGTANCSAEDTAAWSRATLVASAGHRIGTIRSDVTIRNLKVRDGSASADTGGLFLVNFGGDLTINNSDLSNGHAKWGGALAVATDSSVTVDGWSSIFDSDADSEGGAIWIGGGGVVTLADTANIGGEGGNLADEGGGVYIDHGTLEMTDNSKITSNSASNQGGGVAMRHEDSLLSLTDYAQIGDSFLDGNSSAGDGGGVHVSGGTVELAMDSSILNNSAFGRGGGAFLEIENNFVPAPSISFSGNADINSNTALTGGAGLALRDGSIADQPRIIGNVSSVGKGGGILVTGDATVLGGLVSANDAFYGGGVAMVTAESGDLASFEDVWVKDNTAGFGGGYYTDSGKLRILGTGGTSDCDNRDAPAVNKYCSEIRQNFSSLGGALMTSGEVDVVRTAVMGNDATLSDAIEVLSGGDVVLANALVANSGGTGDTTEVIAVSSGGELNAMHATVASNSPTDGVLFELGSTGSFRRSIMSSSGGLEIETSVVGRSALSVECSMFGGTITGPWTGSDVEENTAPGFVTTARGNFRLDSSSNAANKCSIGLNQDLDGDPRAANYDRGAFEAQ